MPGRLEERPGTGSTWGFGEAEQVQLSSKEKILLDGQVVTRQAVKVVLDDQWAESLRGEGTERVWSVRWGG